jgi:hypothetical protein
VTKRNIGYAVVAVLLIAGLVMTYFVVREPDPNQAVPQPPQPVRFTWPDGTDLAGSPSAQLLVEQARRELDSAGISEETLHAPATRSS